MERIRNFCIVAHVDHGKSTLADRILEITGAVSPREMREQFLDTMDIERERGITIKAQTVRLNYKGYTFNLIDTPGHVDFSYEVSRSLAACEGALLLVDATQGVEAQTIANAYLAIDNDLEIIPVINKIDLPSADIERTKMEIETIIGIPAEDALLVSAKEGTGVKELLDAVIERIPPPKGSTEAPLKALIFDSWYDSYLGVVFLVRVFDGVLKKGDKILLMATGKGYEVQKLGVFTPKPLEVDSLGPGEVGFVVAGIKEIRDVKIGDTLTHLDRPSPEPLPGFKPMKPMVFAGIYPVDPGDYEDLRKALEKLSLNDSSIVFEPESSEALGYGFRCGFLGLLHMEIVKERLEREFGLELIVTAPNVVYKVVTTKGEELEIENPSDFPDPSKIKKILEPYVRVTIYLPDEFVGQVLKLCESKRGEQVKVAYLSKERVIITYDLPLAEILVDFYDKLKSYTRGYASMDYDFIGYRESDVVKLDILINGKRVDQLSFLVHRDSAYYKGREVVQRLRSVIPRQLFEVVIQAAIGSRVIARETIKPLRKNVTAKCYGGDVTRKRKLLEKQKEGKKRLKQIGKVEVPQEAFLVVYGVEERR